jgi:phenylpropionate dioxygenase-like ring-hydroxylating dioxygenase large terminal subunit
MSKYTPMERERVAYIGNGPVSALPYHDEAYYQLERQAIFRRTWLTIGRVSEVAERGQFIVRRIDPADTSILVTHAADGKLRAFHNVCTHRGTELVGKPAGRAPTFTCRYHSWTFSADGALRGVPDQAGFFDLDLAKCGLREVALDTCAGFIFVNLTRAPELSLRDYLGQWADDLEESGIGSADTFTEYSYEVEANWKTTNNNFQEIYHGRFVHPKSIGKRSQVAENPFGYPAEYVFRDEGLHSNMRLWSDPNYVPTPTEALAGGILKRDDAARGFTPQGPLFDFFCIFPNTTILSAAGRYFSQTIWPLGPNRTRSSVRVYWTGKDRKASLRFAREQAMTAVLDIHSEDRDIIEAAHRGLKSGAIEHVNFHAHEGMLRYHLAAVDRHVEAYKSQQGAAAETVA